MMYSYNDFGRLFVRYKAEGIPSVGELSRDSIDSKCSVSSSGISPSIDILVDIGLSNGIHIHQDNLSYAVLHDLVGKLEVLC